MSPSVTVWHMLFSVDSIVRKVFGAVLSYRLRMGNSSKHFAPTVISHSMISSNVNWTSFCRKTSERFETLFNFSKSLEPLVLAYTFPLLSTLTSIVNNGFHLYVLLVAVPKQYGNDLRQKMSPSLRKALFSRLVHNTSHILMGAKHLFSI